MARKPPVSGTLSATCRVVLLHGKEAFLRAQFSAQLREMLTEAHGQVDVFTFDGAGALPADILDECRSFGLLSGHKLVIVDNADQVIKEDSRPLFERYAAAPEPGATLLLRAEKWRAGKLDALIAAAGAMIACEPITPHQAIAWAMKRCPKRYGASIAPDAAELLVSRIGPELARLDSELAKVSLAAGAGGVVTRSHVTELVGLSREEEVWEIQNDLLSGTPEEVVARVRYALDVSRHPATLVCWAMTDLARKVHMASAAGRAGTPFNMIARDLKLWGQSQALVEHAARRIGPAEAARLLHACVEADAQSKSGIGEPERLLERLALTFAALGRAR
ncbi:MAG: DNA polymerase III subunit delta [Phycisphaerales bacterium]|nr:DNA polymerase III subunit delta [Phycisphaerales bacterium]